MVEEDTTIRISKEEKQVLDMARALWQRQVGRAITTGEFVHFLAERYVSEVGVQAKSGKPPPASGFVAAQEIRPAQPQEVSPGPQVFLVSCARCGGNIGWNVQLGSEGFCPYCGVYLRMVRQQ